MKLKQVGIYPTGKIEILSNCTRLEVRVILREFPSSACSCRVVRKVDNAIHRITSTYPLVSGLSGG